MRSLGANCSPGPLSTSVSLHCPSRPIFVATLDACFRSRTHFSSTTKSGAYVTIETLRVGGKVVRLHSRSEGSPPPATQILEGEREDHTYEQADRFRNHQIQADTGTDVSFRWYGTIKNLHDGQVFGFRDARLLHLLNEQSHQCLLNLYVTSEPREFEPDLGNPDKRYGEVPSLTR